MKKYTLVLMLALSSAFSYAQNQSKNDTVSIEQQWEYNTIYFHNSHSNAKIGEINFKNHDDTLNEYGKQGWELVSVTPLVASNILNGRVYTSNMCYTFKRRKSIKQ